MVALYSVDDADDHNSSTCTLVAATFIRWLIEIALKRDCGWNVHCLFVQTTAASNFISYHLPSCVTALDHICLTHYLCSPFLNARTMTDATMVLGRRYQMHMWFQKVSSYSSLLLSCRRWGQKVDCVGYDDSKWTSCLPVVLLQVCERGCDDTAPKSWKINVSSFKPKHHDSSGCEVVLWNWSIVESALSGWCSVVLFWLKLLKGLSNFSPTVIHPIYQPLRSSSAWPFNCCLTFESWVLSLVTAPHSTWCHT